MRLQYQERLQEWEWPNTQEMIKEDNWFKEQEKLKEQERVSEERRVSEEQERVRRETEEREGIVFLYNTGKKS